MALGTPFFDTQRFFSPPPGQLSGLPPPFYPFVASILFPTPVYLFSDPHVFLGDRASSALRSCGHRISFCLTLVCLCGDPWCLCIAPPCPLSLLSVGAAFVLQVPTITEHPCLNHNNVRAANANGRSVSLFGKACLTARCA